jgi:hypothetical protein
VPPARREVGIDRVAAEVGVDRQGIRDRLSALAPRLQVGVGVGPRGGADVAALAVHDHEQAGRARVFADLFEGCDAIEAERLEEGQLRLDRDGVRGDRIDDPGAEAGNVAAHLDGEQVRARVEADD